MKTTLTIVLLFPVFLFAQERQDSINNVIIQNLSELQKNQVLVDSLQREFSELKSKYDFQIKINEQTLNSISNQIGAASFNLTVFGILFAIAALGLGLYVTYIERKTVRIREETRALLRKTIETKDEVVTINNQIQKDIYGLFLKIKREETVHILNRLLKVPKDVTNLTSGAGLPALMPHQWHSGLSP